MTKADLEAILSRENPVASALDSLDNREMEVLSLLSQGSNSANICREMMIAPEELAGLKKQIQAKLRLKNEVQLIQFAAKQKMT